MTTITFQFSRPDSASEKPWDRIISEGICKMTRSEICHVDYVTPGGTLIGAHMDGGIQERPADYQKWGLRIRVTIPATEEQAAALLISERALVGTAYDINDIFGIALGDARLHDANKLICSGAQALEIWLKHRIVCVAKEPWQVSPEELRMVLTSQPGATEERIQG
jgi:hypothetical protein